MTPPNENITKINVLSQKLSTKIYIIHKQKCINKTTPRRICFKDQRRERETIRFLDSLAIKLMLMVDGVRTKQEGTRDEKFLYSKIAGVFFFFFLSIKYFIMYSNSHNVCAQWNIVFGMYYTQLNIWSRSGGEVFFLRRLMASRKCYVRSLKEQSLIDVVYAMITLRSTF